MIKLHVNFKRPIRLDFGEAPHTSGTFVPKQWDVDGWRPVEVHPGPGRTLLWVSKDLGLQIAAGSARSWKHAVSNFQRKLSRLRVPFTVRLEEESGP